MRILLAVDTVLTTEIIMSAVSSRPWPRGTRARVISVVEDDTVPLEAWREAGYGPDGVRQEMRRRGEQVAALTVEPLAELGITAEVLILRGDPAWLISYEARKWAADLIFIRAHNRSDFRSWMLGSVAKAVVRETPCSVEVVRVAQDKPPAEGNGHMKILLATDGSGQSAAAAREVAEHSWPEGTEVKVMSAINPLVFSIEETGLFDGGGTHRARRAIGDAAQILKRAGVKTSGEVVAGKACRRIVDEAVGWGADLIVVGSQDRQGLRRLLRGRVSERVASRAPCSVKIVRDRETPANPLARGRFPTPLRAR